VCKGTGLGLENAAGQPSAVGWAATPEGRGIPPWGLPMNEYEGVIRAGLDEAEGGEVKAQRQSVEVSPHAPASWFNVQCTLFNVQLFNEGVFGRPGFVNAKWIIGGLSWPNSNKN